VIGLRLHHTSRTERKRDCLASLSLIDLLRPKQCRERWNEYLSPSIDHSPFSMEEDFIILRAQARLGNKWKDITDLLPMKDPRKKRTPTSVKVFLGSFSFCFCPLTGTAGAVALLGEKASKIKPRQSLGGGRHRPFEDSAGVESPRI
jgi:hypothetical protein